MSALSSAAVQQVKMGHDFNRVHYRMTDIHISKTAAKREARIAEILDCAELQFVESGFHGAGISSIAKTCGISVGHLYHYFASKELLIEAVVERELMRQREKLDDFRSLNAAEIREQIAPKVIDAIVNHQDPFRTVLNFEILAEAQRNPAIANILHKYDREMREEFCNLLAKAGIGTPVMRTEMLFSLFAGIPARNLRHPEQERSQFIELMKPIITDILIGDDCSI